MDDFPTAHEGFVCGVEGRHDGNVIGCCFVCGLLLCRGHAHHIPKGYWIFHRLARTAVGEAQPLVCGEHAPLPFIPLFYRDGLPEKRKRARHSWRIPRVAPRRRTQQRRRG